MLVQYVAVQYKGDPWHVDIADLEVPYLTQEDGSYVLEIGAAGPGRVRHLAREGDWILTDPRGRHTVVPQEEFERIRAAQPHDPIKALLDAVHLAKQGDA